MTTVAEVTDVLKGMGYTAEDTDTAMVEFLIGMVSQNILNQCNLTDVPEELHDVVIYRTCGTFLSMKSATGSLPNTLSMESVVKKIVEGDTTIEFSSPDSTNPQKVFNDYITKLKDYGKRDVAAFRKIRW